MCHGISSLVMNPLLPTAPHDLCAIGARLSASQQLHENSRFQFPGPVQYHHAYTDMWPTAAVNGPASPPYWPLEALQVLL